MCVDKVVIRKSGEELYSKTYQSPNAPQRIVLRPNMHYGRQDTTSSDARTSLDHSSQHKENWDGGTYKETYRGEIDFRIQALPHSAVQEHDHIRKEAVQKLSHQFETHPNKEALQRDLKQNRAFNPFSEQTKEMIYSMGNMEYVEICEITPNIQCPNCVTRWPKVIVFCTCGRCLRPSDKVRKLNSDRYDVLSIPNYVIKKSPFHGARHGNTERQRIHHAAHVSSIKAEKKGFTSILDRFLKCPIYRRSQVDIGMLGSVCRRGSFWHRRQSGPDAKSLEFSCLTVQVRTVPWSKIRLSGGHNADIKNLATLTQDFIPGSKFDSDQINHSLGTMKALCVSTQRQADGGTTRSHQQALLPRDGKRLRGGNLLHGHRHQDGVNDIFSKSRGFEYKQSRFLRKRRRV